MLRSLQAYDWPGNIRQHFDSAPLRRSLVMSLAEAEREHILRVLETTNGQIAGKGGAAAILDLHPNTLRSRMKKLGLAASDVAPKRA